MSRIIAKAAIRGAHKYVQEAEEGLQRAIEAFGPEKKVGFPNTAYYLPLILALTGLEVKDLGDAQKALDWAKGLLPPLPEERLWLPYLGNALDAGIATLIAEELIEALKYLWGEEPKEPWLGFTDDSILRTQGIKLVDGRMPGFAACVGALPTNEEAVELARSLQERSILVFMASSTKGRSMAEQLYEEGVEMNWDTFLVPYGKDTSAAVHALNFAARAAMTFGGIKPGDLEAARKILLYNKERVHAFVLALGADFDPKEDGGQLLTDEKYATAAGAINFGFPVLSDVNIPQILPRGICTYEHVVSGVPLDRIVQKAVEVRGLKLKITKIPIPVPYGAGFEGERVRKENLYVEFGGKYSTAFELLRARPMEEVEDGKIELIGPDIDQAKEGEAMPLGVIVDVAGRNLKVDFEPVLERRIHHFISCINGVMHIGQRDIPWVRISKEAFQKGFRLRHYGEVLVAKFKEDFGAIVDKVQVRTVTDQAEVERLLKEAREIYHQRDERVMGLKDENVDTFYSCVLCVPAGEEIVLADGSFLPVEELIEQAVESDELKVLSWDGCSLSPKPVGELFINPAPAELIRITLKSGNTLTLTPNHKVLVDRDDLEWVPARELQPGDGLLCAKTTYLDGTAPSEAIRLIDLLPDDLLVQDEGFLAELKGALLQKFGSWAEAARELKLDYRRLYGAFYESSNPKVHPRRLTLAEIKRICSALGLSWDEQKLRIRRLGTLGGSFLKKQALDEDLLYAAGLVAADGCVLRRGRGISLQFTNTEPALIARFNAVMAATLGAQPRVYSVQPYRSRSRDGRLVIQAQRRAFVSRVNDQLAGRLMNSLGIGADPTRQRKWSGEIISKLPPKLIAAFLRGLFDGDGHVVGSHVLLTTRSFREAQHIVLLLKKLGINAYISRIKRGFQVGTKRYTDLLAWGYKIGSEHPQKRAKLEAATPTGDRYHASRTDLLPHRCGQLLREILLAADGRAGKLPVDYKSLRAWMAGQVRPSREKLRLVVESLESRVDLALPAFQELVGWCDSALHVERIKHLERIKNTDRAVYNFSVPGTHNYLVNGVVVKNCQSYAPNHVCIVTPQRLGLCGAYTWLDCGASYEMDPHGPNKPVKKGETLDPVHGIFSGVNEYVRVASNGNLEKVGMYSIMTDPQTSCGCFECIAAVLPETNGVMLVNREYMGMTPIGMTFSTMAGEIGGGVQTPGFLGIGKLYITSEKFISAEGGIRRVVWMPKELKEEIKERLEKRLAEIGEPDLIDKIATEEEATTTEELLAFLKRVGHPALEMEPII